MHLLVVAVMLASPTLVTPAAPPSTVLGGEAAGACSWPTSVAIGSCSGTLIHPELVLYAAHCGVEATAVVLGEDTATGTAVATTMCAQHPEYDGTSLGVDFAVCRLAEPVDVSIVPIIMGCERAVLEPGAPLVTAGWGGTPDGEAGIKHVIALSVVEVYAETSVIQVGAEAAGLCGGDSGGGSFVQLADGSWRLAGVSSAVLGTPCTAVDAMLAIASDAVPWIEDSTGIDVTPCHDADGTWNAGPDCLGFPLDPATGGGAWPACEFGALSQWSSTCGAPAGGPPDRTPPTIAITMPQDGASIPLVELTATVTVTLAVDDGGWGVASTHLRIDGAEVSGSHDDVAPFEVPPLALPEGFFTLEAIAIDHAGNEGVSAPVEIVVGAPPLPTGSTGSGDTTGDGEGGDTTGAPIATTTDAGVDDTGVTPAAADDVPAGCGCGHGRPEGKAGLLAAVLLWTRRRRAVGAC